MGTKLYVGNLSFRTTSEELRDAFAAVGTVESASVIEDRDTGRSRGFAFVEMATPEEAAAAMAATAIVAPIAVGIAAVTSANRAGKSNGEQGKRGTGEGDCLVPCFA